MLPSNLSKKLSLKFFNIRKPLEMVIFDKLFHKFILKNKNTKTFISEFNENGYAKLDVDIKDEINVISENLSEPKFNDIDKTCHFELNNKVIDTLNNILNNKLNNTKKYLENYFNSRIFPAYVNISRNLHYEKNEISDELYSNNFHNDSYVLTHFKIFFNLMDVSEKNGPLEIISKKKNSEFIKKSKYKDRHDYKEISDLDNVVYKNIGKKGDVLIFDPTQCIHRASIPVKGNYRDFLTITFVCIPNNENIKKRLLTNLDIFKYENNNLIKYAKPRGFIKSLKLFSKYLQSS
tara:strand:- start:688 stop:1563 length:876 start_codon:yes stop_codon:yes gene_type:complete